MVNIQIVLFAEKKLSKIEVSSRVYAIEGSPDEGHTIEFFGFGVYLGDFIPDENARGWAEYARALAHENPKIQLDNGDIVYGGECWWGLEKDWGKLSKDCKIVIVDINEERQKVDNESRK